MVGISRWASFSCLLGGLDDEVLAADGVHDDRWAGSARPSLELGVRCFPPLLVGNSTGGGTSKYLLVWNKCVTEVCNGEGSDQWAHNVAGRHFCWGNMKWSTNYQVWENNELYINYQLYRRGRAINTNRYIKRTESSKTQNAQIPEVRKAMLLCNKH